MSCFVFDFDGVLANTLEVMVDAMHKKLPFISQQKAKQMLVERSMKARPKTSFSYKMIKKYGKDGYSQELGANHGQHLLNIDRLDEIAQLDLSKHSTYILTHSYTDICQKMLEDRAKLFSVIWGNENHDNKTEALGQIVQIEALKNNTVYFFSDTLGDVLDAKPVLRDQQIFACTWGFLPSSVFEDKLPKSQILTESFFEAKVFADSIS